MAPSVASAQRNALMAFGVVCLAALVGGLFSQGGVADEPSQRSEAPPSADPIAEAHVEAHVQAPAQAPVQATDAPAPPEAGRAAPEPLVVRVQYGGVDGVSPHCLSELSPIRLDWSDMAQWAQADPRQPEALQLALRAAANQQPIPALSAIGAPATDAEHFYTLMRAFLVPESANAIDFEAGLRAIVATEGSPYLAYAAGMLASTGLPLDARVAFIEDRMREASPPVAAEIAWNAACAPETLSALSADTLAKVEGAVEPGDGAIAVAVGAEWALRGDVARGRALMERGLASLQAQGVGHPQRAEDLRLPSPPDDPNTVVFVPSTKDQLEFLLSDVAAAASRAGLSGLQGVDPTAIDVHTALAGCEPLACGVVDAKRADGSPWTVTPRRVAPGQPEPGPTFVGCVRDRLAAVGAHRPAPTTIVSGDAGCDGVP